MKKNLHILMAACCMTTATALAQNQYTHSANAQLRSIFSQITYPDPAVDYLYERSVKLADSVFYGNFVSDTLDAATWFQLHTEMYYAAHDTTPLTTTASVINSSYQYSQDTIPIVLMDLDYYYLKPQALNTGTWFIFDTVANQLYDNPSRPNHPFNRANIFSASPAFEESEFANVNFLVDPSLMFTDITNSPYYTAGGGTLKIDFGDGSGWQVVNSNGSTVFPVTYPAQGNYVITTALFDATGEKIKQSLSRIAISNSSISVPADYEIGMPGMQVGIYNSCVPEHEQKAIIYLEGFDLLDMLPGLNRNIPQIYKSMISDPEISNLRNFGYTFYVVDWKNSRIDMRFNALYLINLIEYIKSKSKNKQQITIIGESMGGVIARYALTFMETPEYQAGDFSSFLVEQNDSASIGYIDLHPGLSTVAMTFRDPSLIHRTHNTRLLITLDSPHQGANIPLSIQQVYYNAFHLLPLGGLKQMLANSFNVALAGKASRQLLKFNIFTGSGSNATYTADASFTSFFDQLETMGDYPQFTKLVALSSGSLNGTNQKNYFTQGLRSASDKLLDVDMAVYGRLLYKKIPLVDLSLECLTNPNGNGSFYQFRLGRYLNVLKLKWFGLNVTSIYLPIANTSRSAVNCKSYCTSPGGYSGLSLTLPAGVTQSYQLSNKWLLNLFSYSSSFTSGGCYLFSSHAGINGLASVNLNLTACTDGLQFGFVPVQSALDYGKGLNLPLNHNIETENISTKLSRTPFDVIAGYTTGKGNLPHLVYRSDRISNCTNFQANVPMGLDCYYSPLAINKCISRRWLSLEVGDEEMYLENLKLPYEADYQPEFDLHVNQRNPYYNYISGSGLSPLIGVYSKEGLFQIIQTGKANFYFDTPGSPSPTPGLSISPPFAGPFDVYDQPLYICAQNFRTVQTQKSNPISRDLSVEVYPVPSFGKITIEIPDDTGAEVTISGIKGDIIYKGSLNERQSELTLDTSPGLYFISIQLKEQTITKKLILH